MVQEIWETKEAALKTRILILKPKFEELMRDPSSRKCAEALEERPLMGASWYTGLKRQMKEFVKSESKLMATIGHFEMLIRANSPLPVLHAENRKPLALYLSIAVMTGTKQPRFALP
jgi:hypothetical protein